MTLTQFVEGSKFQTSDQKKKKTAYLKILRYLSRMSTAWITIFAVAIPGLVISWWVSLQINVDDILHGKFNNFDIAVYSSLLIGNVVWISMIF